MATKTAKSTSILGQWPKQVDRTRVRAEKLAKRALDLLPKNSRKMVKDVTSRVEKATRDLQRRSERAMKDAEAQRKKLVSAVERGAADVVKPLVDRLDIASRADVNRLSRRIAQLERKVQQQTRRAAA